MHVDDDRALVVRLHERGQTKPDHAVIDRAHIFRIAAQPSWPTALRIEEIQSGAQGIDTLCRRREARPAIAAVAQMGMDIRKVERPTSGKACALLQPIDPSDRVSVAR